MSSESARRYMQGLDERHLAYARAYADELSLGEPAPSSAGLDSETVREIRRLLWREWRGRIAGMPGSRPA